MMRLKHRTDMRFILSKAAEKSAFVTALFFVVTFVTILPHHGLAEEPVKSPYQIRFGTIEINADRSRNYIFRWDGREEIFDTSLNAFLSASGTNLPGLPDLKEIGFKTASGEIFKYEGVLQMCSLRILVRIILTRCSRL